jgi:Zn-dependent protease
MTAALGWKFSAMLIAVVSWHECGHILMSKRLGYRTGGFIFLPFIGGMSFSNMTEASVYDRALVYLAGPLSGLIISIVSLIAGLTLHNNFMLAICVINCYINLFNLTPLGGLDGGGFASSMFNSISLKVYHKFKIFSLVALIGLFFILKSPAVIMMAMFAYMDLKNPGTNCRYQFKMNKTITYLICYFSMIGLYLTFFCFLPSLNSIFVVLK